mgnify:CR=1 FL=1
MYRDVATRAEIQCLRRKYLGNVDRDFIRLLLFIIIWLTLSLRLIIASYQFASLININLALNMLTSRSL